MQKIVKWFSVLLHLDIIMAAQIKKRRYLYSLYEHTPRCVSVFFRIYFGFLAYADFREYFLRVKLKF